MVRYLFKSFYYHSIMYYSERKSLRSWDHQEGECVHGNDVAAPSCLCLHAGCNAALLAWQSVRLLKYMLEPVPDAGDGLINAFWYLYYIFRAALPVALLWIAHVADRDAVARRMPPHLLALLLLNLVLAAAILTNDWHEQVFSFPQEREGGEWEEKLEWGAYAYWTIWFLEVFAALAILWVKAGLQKIWRPQMVLPVALCGLFLAYSIFYNFLPLVRIDVTFTTTGFFLLLLELCLQTGLMPSNDEHESFFREASPGLMLLDEKGRARLVSKAVPGGEAERKDYRISKMKVPGGGTLVWYEDMHLLRERAAQMMQDRLREEVESLLKGLRPYFREFREEILKTEGEAQKHAVHKLNLLATYTKKRCVLFLKSEESGRIALDDFEMASSEICSALRAFRLHAAIDWKMPDEMPAQTALLAFDALTTFLAEAARSRAVEDIYVTMAEARVTFLVEQQGAWLARWQALWHEGHAASQIAVKDLGYAVSVDCSLTEEVKR